MPLALIGEVFVNRGGIETVRTLAPTVQHRWQDTFIFLLTSFALEQRPDAASEENTPP